MQCGKAVGVRMKDGTLLPSSCIVSSVGYPGTFGPRGIVDMEVEHHLTLVMHIEQVLYFSFSLSLFLSLSLSAVSE